MGDRRQDEVGAIYLLHLEPALAHARHYVGFVPGLEPGLDNFVRQRVEQHRAGGGSPLVRAALARPGALAELVHVWKDMKRRDERRIKDGGNVARHCPRCRAEAMRRAATNQKALRDRTRDRARRMAEGIEAERRRLQGGAR